MKRLVVAALASALVIGLQCQAALAQPKNNPDSNTLWYWISHGQPLPLVISGWIVGGAAAITSFVITEKHGNPGVRHVSYGTAYGVTSLGCMVVYPMVATVAINRPLTPREAYVGMADCALPFVGGWIVDAILPHDAWTDGLPPRKVRHHHS